MGKKVGALIKKARLDAGYTQEQLARKVKGVSASEISAAERGTLDLTQQNLKDIAKATGVTQASLINASSSSSRTTTRKTSSSTKRTTSRTTTRSTSTTGAKSSMQVTATERKLINLYRNADSDAKKRAMSALKGTMGEDIVSDLVQGAIEGVFKKKK